MWKLGSTNIKPESFWRHRQKLKSLLASGWREKKLWWAGDEQPCVVVDGAGLSPQGWTVTSTWSASEISSARTSAARCPPLSSGTTWEQCTTCRLWWGDTHTRTHSQYLCMSRLLLITETFGVFACAAARVGDLAFSEHREELLSAWWHHPGR